MKKYLLVLVLVVVLSFAMSDTASANGGPHGGYTPTTDACAGCHRAHTAQGPQLLTVAGTYALCVSCHGSAGSGANTNVDDGRYLSTRDDAAGNGDVGAANTPDNALLLGGGFVNYNSVGVTSTHDPTGVETDAWGNGVNRGVLNAMAGGDLLDCASCHDPHGSTNYRILNTTVNAVPVTVSQVDEGAAKDYNDENWPADISNICAACHQSYHETAANVGSSLPAQTYGGGYTHRVDVNFSWGGNANPETVGLGGFFLPLADSGTTDLLVCNTCHFSHGTSAQMTGIADDPAGTGTLPGNTTAADSALLRLDNRGVCEVCHQK